jgi:hypothetical protein
VGTVPRRQTFAEFQAPFEGKVQRLFQFGSLSAKSSLWECNCVLWLSVLNESRPCANGCQSNVRCNDICDAVPGEF